MSEDTACGTNFEPRHDGKARGVCVNVAGGILTEQQLCERIQTVERDAENRNFCLQSVIYADGKWAEIAELHVFRYIAHTERQERENGTTRLDMLNGCGTIGAATRMGGAI